MKNRIIIINKNDNEIIIFYKKINNVVSNINNFRVLDYKIYIYIFKIIKRYKFNNRY